MGIASRANRFSEKFKMYLGGKETGWMRDIQSERNYEVEDLNNMSWFDIWHQDMRSNVRVKNTNIQVEQQQQQQQRQLQQVNFKLCYLAYESTYLLIMVSVRFRRFYAAHLINLKKKKKSPKN